MKNILFISYGGGHVSMLIPIIKAVLRKPGYTASVVGLTTAAAALRKAGVEYYGFRDFLDSDDSRAIEIGKEMSKSISNQNVSSEESIAYLGLSYVDLEVRLGVEEAARKYKKVGRQAFLPMTVMERIFNKFQPDIVVTTNSPRAEQAAIVEARKRNIPAVCLVDLFAILEIERISDNEYADAVCVISNDVKKHLVSNGRNPNSVYVTGNPAFDSLHDAAIRKKGREFRSANQWENKKVILWASQIEPEIHKMTMQKGNPDLPSNIEKKMIDILNAHPDWVLVIRPHPSENRTAKTNEKNIYWSDSSQNISMILNAVDVVVTMTSTVGLQAHDIDLPVITVDLSIGTDFIPMSKFGISHGITDLEDLEDALNTNLSGHGSGYKAPETTAAEKVLHVIDECLSK